jgi:hypothetical protein
MFNGLSSWLTLSMGVMGWGIAGPLGAILGFAGGAAFWEHLARKHRFYRP